MKTLEKIYAYLMANDKVFHIVICMLGAIVWFWWSQFILFAYGIPNPEVSLIFGFTFALAMGVQKEVLDKIQGRAFDKRDLVASGVGAVLGSCINALMVGI